MLDRGDYMAPTRPHELDRANQDLSTLKDLDHEEGIDGLSDVMRCVLLLYTLLAV